MAVSVSLEVLVSVGCPRSAWPADFAEMVKRLEASPADRTLCAALADWCQDHDEHGLARAFRWVAKRDEVLIERDKYYAQTKWTLENLPRAVAAWYLQECDRTSAAGAVAELAQALRRLDQEVA